ncbi:MAG: iron ABC transporter permease [Oscillospiraceae bacterium]|nr:iron ABC transporter permease [Oscillospiraceae bacterium]
MMKNKPFFRLTVCFGVLLASVLIGICAGTVWISPTQLFSEILTEGLSQNERVVLYIRLPRIIAAVLAGSALAVSGAVIQAVLGNPLAAPNIIGVNSGAGMFTVICIALFPTAVKLLPAAAFLGALAAVLFVYGIARKIGASRMTIVLTGVGVSSLFNAVIDTVTTLYPDALLGMSAFKTGGVAGVTVKSLFPAWIFIAVGIGAALMLSHDLDILSLGENTAKSLGMNVGVIRFLFLAIAALLAGAAVSFSGLIGFVGLVVPHISRKITGSSENTAVLPVCTIIGGAFLALCDTFARTVAAPYELPLGIIVSYIGVPFFIWLLIRKKGGKHSD